MLDVMSIYLKNVTIAPGLPYSILLDTTGYYWILLDTRAGTNTLSDEYDSYREYRVANTNMYSRIHFFSEAKLDHVK